MNYAYTDCFNPGMMEYAIGWFLVLLPHGMMLTIGAMRILARPQPPVLGVTRYAWYR